MDFETIDCRDVCLVERGVEGEKTRGRNDDARPFSSVIVIREL